MSSCASPPDCPSVNRRCSLPVFAMDCETGYFDLALSDCSVKTDCQVQSQLIMALYGRARDNSRPECNRGGWWGGDFGSRLWTLQNTVISDEDDTVNRAEQYLTEALSPLAAQGIIDDVSVNASIQNNVLSFDDIIITRPEGQTNFSYLWDRGCS